MAGAGEGSEHEAGRATARLVSALAERLSVAAQAGGSHDGTGPGGAPDREPGSDRIVETHISWIILAGRRAYKIKKPLRLDFLDFSTLALRRRACEDELRLNRRTAPELYLRVVPICGTPDAPNLTPGERVIEYAVEMRRFDPDALFANRLAQGAIDGALVDALAERVARFHASLPPASTGPSEADPAPGREAVRSESSAGREGAAALATARRNLRELFGLALDPPRHRRVEALARWIDACGPTLEPLLLARARAGFVRECHGDLHLANVALIDGQPVLFDCLEFDLALRTIDVLDETAFAYMDFLAHDRKDLGTRFLNAYLESTGDYEGVPCLALFTLHRALVRAKVAAIRRGQAGLTPAEADRLTNDLDRHLRVAEAQTRVQRPLLLVTCGLAGSGKTTVGGALVEAIPALRLRSDVERKRLAGLDASARTDSPIAGGLYDPAQSERTYARLEQLARTLLGSGWSVVVDAAFLSRDDRARFRRLAGSLGARFRIVLCDAPVDVLRERVAARARAGRDASEAGLAVLEHQLQTREAPGDDEREETASIATDAAPEAVRAACAALAARLRGERPLG